MVFNATFNNISVISWRSVLLVEETRVPGENHWHTVSHNVVSSTPAMSRIQTFVVIGTDCSGSCRCTRYNIMWSSFVSDLPRYTCSWNVVENSIKHHNHRQIKSCILYRKKRWRVSKCFISEKHQQSYTVVPQCVTDLVLVFYLKNTSNHSGITVFHWSCPSVLSEKHQQSQWYHCVSLILS